MLIHREAADWVLIVPAKINLYLEVLGRRTDGYHDLDTVMSAVSLCDRLRFRATKQKDLRLNLIAASDNGFEKLSNEDKAWEIPNDQSNLVVRALEAVRQRYGIEDGMEIQLTKGIPSQAGLGGGSSNAAGAIVGGMLAWRGEFQPIEAAELASGLGSDINFFIQGRSAGIGDQNWLARCAGRGELVTPIVSDWMLDLVVVNPPQGCLTKSVFRRLAESNWTENGKIADELIHSMKQQDRTAMAKKLFNRLGVPAAAENPWIDRIEKILADEPWVLGSCVSGSGSSVFAVVETAEQSKLLADRLIKNYPVRAYAVRSWQTPSIGEQLSTINSR